MTDSKNPETDHVVTALPTALNAAQDIIPETTGRRAWFRRFWPLILATTMSLLWVGICIWWYMASGKTMARMPLYEAGGLLAGAALPLVLIWLIALVYLRTDPLRDHRTALSRGMDDLLAPLDVAQRRVNSIVAGLHKEIKHIEAAGDIATTRIDNLEKRFQDQISSLFDVTTDAEAKAKSLQVTLSSEREAFSGLVTEITEHATELENLFQQIKFDSEGVTNITRRNSEKVSNEITFQNKTLDERSRLIEKQLEKMAGELVNMSRQVSENCTASENNLNNLSQSLMEKQAALTESFTMLAQNTDDICGKMDGQSRTIAETSEKVAQNSERISATLTGQAEALATITADAMAQTVKSGEIFQAEAEAMGKKLDEATEKSKTQIMDASNVFKDTAAGIVQSSQTLSENLIGHMGRATDDLQVRSETLEHTITLRVNALEEALEKQAEIIRQRLAEQTQEMQTALDRNAASADAFISQQGGSFTENITRQFTDIMAQLESQTGQIQKFASEATGKLEDTVSSVEQQAKRVDEAVTLTTDSLNEKTEMMQGRLGSFEQVNEEFRQQLDRSEARLKAQHETIVKSLSDVTDHMDNSLQKLKDQSGSLGEHAQDVISNIVGQTEHLSEHIDDIRQRTEHTIRNIREMGETVSSHFNATDEQAATLSDNWLKTASLVENQCSETLSRLDVLTNKLAELEQENNAAVENAENNAARVADQMQNASESIYLASASAVEAADETNRVIDQHADKFQQLINAIQLSNKSILIDAEAIEQKILEKSGNHFSNLASRIIEQLQSLSIDINRHFEDDVPDKVWQSYIDGDKNTFIRRLKKLTSKKHLEAIGEKYKSDGEFRKYALEYMQIFEDLMSKSMASDSYSTFSVALISSETGKVYLILAQATDRFSS